MFENTKQSLNKNRKPSFESGKKIKEADSYEQKLKKIGIFYRYRIGSIYRQMKVSIYEKLLQQKKQKSSKTIKNIPIQNKKASGFNSQKDAIESLYKMVTLNSKYHHREKMRFSRTPLMKYIQYDFNLLSEKLKNKQYASIYDDLIESDQQQKQDDKKQHQKDPQFSQNTINNFKKKNNINGKIVAAQGYEDLKARLIEKYGWTQNVDTHSLVYDFKYMSKKKDIDYVNLLDGQIVNHFHQNKSITAKFGLTRNIRNIVLLGKDHNQFFPRCYDINDVKQLQDFYEDFKFTQAKTILKNYIQKQGKVDEKQQQIVKMVLKYLELENIEIQKKISLIINQKPIYIDENSWKIMKGYLFNKNKQQNKTNQKLYEQALKFNKFFEKSDAQYFLNKQNIWIVKPASMSRGRGIKTFNDLTQILDYIIGKQISWVVQKYIQKPLIIRRKKFDIRQWVLVTDLKPFRVWIYEECYVRFCSQTYEPQNLKNRKIHLTNNSVTKGINNIEDGINGNMMSDQQFGQQLKHIQSKDVLCQIIKPQIQKIAIQSLESVKQNIVSRKNTFELFGYDFMIDENYKTWLIQVNSSPTMQHSTDTTTKIVRKGMSHLADLVENYMLKGKIYNKEQASKLYGGWKLLTNYN